ncbi:allantoinase AllB [Verticiella sediminum]|uniref:allantoinase n=1 Tax=Verticiella sediminum TaxID=1247510 RepID=A0A556AIT7_9BURK|nr:allantoinase AllB [Verticiella sediminum]TSH92786.1 allantoinase AllB [Verticiella sediminum]
MKKLDLLIRGGTLVLEGRIVPGNLGVRDGRIVSVGERDHQPAAHDVFDARGLHVLPGAIDCHVHFRDPGSEYKETWRTGSAAAAAGGVTTVLDMPNTNPPTSDLPGAQAKRQRARAQSVVDWGLYGVLDETSLPHLDALIDSGIVGFKCFMTETTGDLPSPDDGVIFEGFEHLARRGVRCSVHAENAAIMQRRRRSFIAQGRSDPAAHEESRPEVCEIEAVRRTATLASAAGNPVHIAHVSSGGGARAIAEAQRLGLDLTAETCPQYLLFDSSDVARMGGLLRVNPPIRGAGHRDALWAAMHQGVIGMIATDHAPHTWAEKMNPSIWECCRGMIGLESQMAVMLTEVQRGRLSLLDYVRFAATNPAKAWGLYPNKGTIAVGTDADLALVDLDASTHVDQETHHSLNRISPWHGRLITAKPVHTFVRGRLVYTQGRVIGEPGWGREIGRCAP